MKVTGEETEAAALSEFTRTTILLMPFNKRKKREITTSASDIIQRTTVCVALAALANQR